MERAISLMVSILAFILIGCQLDSKDEINGVSIETKVFIDKPVEEVYESYTTIKGLKKFLFRELQL